MAKEKTESELIQEALQYQLVNILSLDGWCDHCGAYVKNWTPPVTEAVKARLLDSGFNWRTGHKSKCPTLKA